MPNQEWIRTALKERGHKLKDVADTLGVPAPRVTDILKGTRGVQSHEVMPLSQLLGINAPSLLESLKLGKRTLITTGDDTRLPILGSLTGNGVITPLPSDVTFDNVPIPPDVSSSKGLFCYVMGDGSMSQDVPPGSLIIAADPKQHYAPIVPGSLLLIDMGNNKHAIRRYTKTDSGEDWLIPMPETPNPDFASWRFSLLSSLLPGGEHVNKQDIVRIDDVLAVVLWVHQRRAVPA